MAFKSPGFTLIGFLISGIFALHFFPYSVVINADAFTIIFIGYCIVVITTMIVCLNLDYSYKEEIR